MKLFSPFWRRRAEQKGSDLSAKFEQVLPVVNTDISENGKNWVV